MRKEYTGDDVINRGYAIYDEWKEKKFSSRKIAAYVERVASLVKQNKKNTATIEALACLFALDTRIKEKYNNLLRCLLSYFSWRRETRVLKFLKGSFNVFEDESDIRTSIEIVLEKLRENIDFEDAEGEEDEARGGKRNGKVEDEAVSTEDKKEEQLEDDVPEDISDIENEKENKEKISEEKPKEFSEQIPNEEPIKENREQQTTAEEKFKDTYSAAQDNQRETFKKEEYNEFKKENYGFDDTEEPSTDKKQEAKTYNDAIDFVPLYEEQEREKPVADKLSFIDEVILDNMIKNKEIIGFQKPVEGLRQNGEATILSNMNTNQNLKSDNKEDYLYDEMLRGAKFKDLQQNGTKNELPKAPQTNTANKEATKQDIESTRVPIKVDMTQQQENELRDMITSNMSAESILEHHKFQADMMREQLEALAADVGMNDPVEIVCPTDLEDKQTEVELNRK